MKKAIKSKVRTTEIKFVQHLYPRNDYSWQTAYDYSESMKSGALFPPITLAQTKKGLVLVDGKHRFEALKVVLGVKKFKQAKMDAYILIGLNEKQIFEEAIRLNIAHGRVLSVQEKLKVALKLEEMGYAQAKISDLIQIPLNKLTSLKARKLTNSITGEPIVLKQEVEHLANSNSEYEEQWQDRFKGVAQNQILDELINLLTTKTIDDKNPKIREKLKKIKALLRKY